MMKIMNLFKRIVSGYLFQHILFWVASYCFFLFLIFTKKQTFAAIPFIDYFDILVTNIIIAIPVYINLMVLVPYLFRRKRYFIYLFFVIAVVVTDTVLLIFVDKWFFSSGSKEAPHFLNQLVGSSLFTMLYVTATTFIKFMRDVIKLQGVALKVKEMESQNLAIELKSLKEQVNPHFLFNTLNNIYSLSLDRSEKTPGLILKLSDLIRYMIYDCTETFVDAGKEITFINNYIELERLRLDEKVVITMSVFGDVNDKKIAPLLFIPFIENAFKHGICRTEVNSFVTIDFKFTEDNRVSFRIENSRENRITGIENDHKPIGIENARKRLELIYPGKHELNIKETESTFCVELTIQSDNK